MKYRVRNFRFPKSNGICYSQKNPPFSFFPYFCRVKKSFIIKP